ncbi:MAG: methyltransferase domain-containing protein [Planctomycetota bacterium]|nr:methyltransferase domain-containing protein [Planctomycetota bacterium]
MSDAPKSPWDPNQYERYKKERAQPFFDLLGLVQPRPGMRVADLGCGTGELTRELHRKLQARETLGLDSSPSMLAECAKYPADGLRFEQGEIAAFAPAQPLDLVFTNAALHWLPGHEDLLERIAGHLAPDGQLAVQVPSNQTHPSQSIAYGLAKEEPYEPYMRHTDSYENVLPPERYAELLHRLGFREQRVFLRVYGHVLPARADVIEWVKGTTLTRFKRALPEALYAQFLEAYRTRLFSVLEDRAPYFYPFKRILMWGAR